MAYVTVMKECLTHDHKNCERYENLPPPNSEIVGGGHCICPCHSGINMIWYEEVYHRAMNKYILDKVSETNPAPPPFGSIH